MISMKRIICLALVLVLLFQILVVPAAAVDPLTGIIVSASAAAVIGSAVIGLGVLPGTDGSVFNGLVSEAAGFLADLGFGDGVNIPILKYIGAGGGIQYALQSTILQALRNLIFDYDIVEVSSPVSSGSVSFNYSDYSFSSTVPGSFFVLKYYYSSSATPYFYYLTFFSDSPGSISSSAFQYAQTLSSYEHGYYKVISSIIGTPSSSVITSVPIIDCGTVSSRPSDVPSVDWHLYLNSSQYDLTLGDIASPDTSLAVGYPNWAIDSVQVDPGNGDDPIPYVPIGLDDRYEGVTQEDVQSGESTLETPNDGTQVNISGDVGGSLTPDGGGSGDLPGGEGSVTVDDLTTMFAWLAVRIDEAVQSLFPDLQVIKTYLKTIAQWHETENVKYDSMLSYFSGWDADIDTMLTTVSNIDLNLTTLVDHAAASSDTLAAIAADVQDIRDVIADPLDSDINEEEQDNKNAFLNSFSKKSQAKSIGDLSGLSDGFTDWFALDVDPGLMFDQFDTGFGDWFTSETAQAISVGGGAAAAGISLMDDDFYVEPDTPYLDAWDQEVQDILSGGD